MGKEWLSQGLIGYIQTNDSSHWFKKINDWIQDEIENSHNPMLTWNVNDKLSIVETGIKVCQYISHSIRLSGNVIDLRPFVGKSDTKTVNKSIYLLVPQHFLYFLPLPQGQGSLRPTLLETIFSSNRRHTSLAFASGYSCLSCLLISLLKFGSCSLIGFFASNSFGVCPLSDQCGVSLV